MALRLGVEREQPGPAIGPLEPAGIGAVEIGELAGDLARRQHLVDQRLDPRAGRQVGEKPGDAQQQPPAVDAAVPVEAAEEDRMKRARPGNVLRPVQDMVELVRIFAADMADAMSANRRRSRG